VNLVEDFLAHADPSALPGTLVSFRPAGTVLVSARKDTSRYATALLLDSTGSLRVVAKIARRPHHQERLAAELELLRLLEHRHKAAPVAPSPIALVQHRDHWMLLETALNVRFLRRPHPRAYRRTWERVEAWLRDLVSPASTVDEEWFTDQIADPMRRLEQALPATKDEEQLFAETRSLTRELTSLSVPAPFEHGDLFRAHLGTTSGGSLAAIDWELGRHAGLAGADATIFLLDLFRPSAGGLAADPAARVYAESFLDLHGPARQWLAEHLERLGVERRWVEHILLAALARRALHIWEPVVSEARREQGGQLHRASRSFRRFWAVRLWRMTLEHMTARRRPVASPSGIGE
jgi:hypothetical protein